MNFDDRVRFGFRVGTSQVVFGGELEGEICYESEVCAIGDCFS